MAVQILPTDTESSAFSFTIELEQVSFLFEFHWNDRDAAYYFSISDSNGVPLLSGRKVVLGIPLLSRFRTIGLPAGEICAIDTTDTDTEPGFGELGTDARCRLLYIDFAELPSALVA